MISGFIKALLLPFLSPGGLLWLMRHFGKKGSLGYPNFNKELWFSLLAKSHSGLTFAHIGAHDGVKNDPIFPYVKKHGWRGVLVEPVPFFFDQLKANYAGTPHLAFENVGIADTDGTLEFFHLPAHFDDPNWLQQIGTFDRHAIEFNLAERLDLLPHITSIHIPTISLKTLFERNHITQLDLLLLDVEGLEWRILQQLRPLSVRPRYLFFEWGCMEKTDLDALLQFLESAHYEFYSSGGDVLAVNAAGAAFEVV
jgi:FkbM family methyltransferase